MHLNQYNVLLNEERCPFIVREGKCELPTDTDTLRTALEVYHFFIRLYHADILAEEYMWMLAYDVKCHVIGVFEIGHGTDSSVYLSPREIFVRLCLAGANSFLLVHNHPSGVSQVSKEDMQITDRLKACGELMNIPLLDHIVIGRDEYFSFREEGLIEK